MEDRGLIRCSVCGFHYHKTGKCVVCKPEKKKEGKDGEGK